MKLRGVRFGHLTASLFAVLILGWLWVATWQVNEPYHNLRMLPLFGWISGIIAITIAVLAYCLRRRFTGWYILTLILGSLPKLALIVLFPIRPQSDMWSYNFEAQMLLAKFSWRDLFNQGWLDFSMISPHVFHISSTFHWLYWLFGHQYFVIQLVNVFLAAFCCWLLYVLVSSTTTRAAGIIAGLTFFVIPANYVYSCLMGAEYFQLTAILLAILALKRLVAMPLAGSRQFWWVLLGVWVSVLAAAFYRPNASVIVIAICGWLLFTKMPFKHKLMLMLLIAGPITLVDQYSATIDRVAYGIPIANRSVETGYTLATGWNRQSQGMYSYELVTQIERIRHTGESTAHQFKQMQDLFDDSFKDNLRDTVTRGELPEFVHTKLKILANPNFGFNFFYVENREKLADFRVSRAQIRAPLTALSTAFQLLWIGLLVLGSLVNLVGLWWQKRVMAGLSVLLLTNLLFVGFVLSSLLVEVQPRYQMAWYVPMALMTGLLIGRLPVVWPAYRERHDAMLKWLHPFEKETI